MRHPWLALLLLLPALAGCVDSPDVEGVALEPDEVETPPPGVVVADIGAGTNPYHEAFRRDWPWAPWERVPGMPELPVLDLTLGDDWEANLAADAAVWESFEVGPVYWVRGTNVLLWTREPFAGLPAGEWGPFHGSATAGAVNDACPGCYVLSVQDRRNWNGDAIQEIAETMPWVDVTTSTTFHGGYNAGVDPAGPELILGSHHYAKATRALWDSGRIHVSFAGNHPVSGFMDTVMPFPTHDFAFPPWVVMVGGAHSECGSVDGYSGRPTEFVGNFTQNLPANASVEDRWWTSGTSFSTPQVAGVLGATLLAVRDAVGPGAGEPGALWTGPPGPGALEDGILTQEEIRQALASVARYFATEDYDPLCRGLVPLPVGPAPWVTMGWGYLGPEEAAGAALVLLGETAPEKPQEAHDWMDAFTQARELLYPW